MRTNLLFLVMLTCLGAAESGKTYPGWPNWRGAGCNGSVSEYEEGLDYIDSIADAKFLWRSEQMVGGSYRGSGCGVTCSGPSSPIAADGKVFLYYYATTDTSKVAFGTYDREKQRHNWNSHSQENAKHWYHKSTHLHGVLSEDQFVHLWCNVYAEDRVLCLDALTGKTLWQRTLGGTTSNTMRSSSKWEPAYANGLLVAAGESGSVCCFDATTGELQWEWIYKPWAVVAEGKVVANAKTPVMRGRWGRTHNLMIADGVAFVPFGYPNPQIHALDLKTGELLWDHLTIKGKKQIVAHSVPLRWVHKDKEYIVIGNRCLEPRTGKLVWEAKGAMHGGRGRGSMALSEDYLVVNQAEGGRSVSCYRIAPGKAELVWSVPKPANERDRGNSSCVIYGDYAYTIKDRKQINYMAVELATGKVVQKEELGDTAQGESARLKGCSPVSSPYAFGGRVCYRTAKKKDFGHVVSWSAAPQIAETPQFLKPPTLASSITPCVAEGKLIMRSTVHVMAYDLLKPGSKTWPAPDSDPACKEMQGSIADLGSPFKTERDNAARAVAAVGDASVQATLVTLIRNARFTTAEAAGLALSQMKPLDAARSAALKALVDDPELTTTRLSVALHAWHGSDPEAAVGWLRDRLRNLIKAENNKGLGDLVQVLRHHRFLDSALIEETALDLGASLSIADAATLNALGHVLVTLCEEPELLVPLIDPLVQALTRVNADGCYSATLALEVGLKASTDTSLQQIASNFALSELKTAVSSGSEHRMNAVARLLRACPRPMVAERALQTLEGKGLKRQLKMLQEHFKNESQ